MQLIIVVLLLFSVIARGSVNNVSPEDQILIDNNLSDHDTHFRIDSDEEDAGPQRSFSFPYPVLVTEVYITPGQRITRLTEAVKGKRCSLDPALRTQVTAYINGATQVVAVNVQKGKFYLSNHPMFDYVDKSKPKNRSVEDLND